VNEEVKSMVVEIQKQLLPVSVVTVMIFAVASTVWWLASERGSLWMSYTHLDRQSSSHTVRLDAHEVRISDLERSAMLLVETAKQHGDRIRQQEITAQRISEALAVLAELERRSK
jgi:hypothetical protein